MLYIYGKGEVEKNKIVHAIELEYAVLLQDFNLVITIPTNIAADNIGYSIIYINFAISIKN